MIRVPPRTMKIFMILFLTGLGLGNVNAEDRPIIEIKRFERTNSSIVVEGSASVVPPGTKMRVAVQRIDDKSIGQRHIIKTVDDVVVGSDGAFIATLKRHGSLSGFDFPNGKYELEFYAGFTRAWQTIEVAQKAGVKLDEQGRSDSGEPHALPTSSDLIFQTVGVEKVRFLRAIRIIDVQPTDSAIPVTRPRV
jgi:hypothetical protein